MIIIGEGKLALSDEKSKFCSHCGSSVKTDDAFCNNCGASLTEIVEIAAKTPVADYRVVDTSIPQQFQPVIVDLPTESRNITAIVSIALGVIAISLSFVWFMFCLSVPFGVAALITGIIGVFRQKWRYLGVIGIVLALIAVLLFLLQYFGVFWVSPFFINNHL